MLSLVYDYIHTMAHYVCCLWDSLEQVWGVSVQQVALWWVCVGIIWL